MKIFATPLQALVLGPQRMYYTHMLGTEYLPMDGRWSPERCSVRAETHYSTEFYWRKGAVGVAIYYGNIQHNRLVSIIPLRCFHKKGYTYVTNYEIDDLRTF